MGTIPHSGDRCSGLCVTPCDHQGCWQCADVKRLAERKKHTDPDCNDSCRLPCGHPSCKDCFNFVYKQDRRQRAVERGTSNSKTVSSAASILGSVPSRNMPEQTTITRVALENLCKRAGLKLDWNDGDPIVHDERGWQSAQSWSAATPAQQKAKTFDDAVRQIVESKLAEDLQKSINEVTRAKAKAAEDAARQRLRDQGASEADIEAAIALMDWKPEGEKSDTDMGDWQSIVSAKLIITKEK